MTLVTIPDKDGGELMPTYEQLQQEAAWRAEVVPASIERLGRNVRTRLGLARDAIGTKGNNEHTYGYHRSRRWILASRWSDDGASDYSVTAQLDQGGDANWVCAIDISAPPEILLPMCQRLDQAVRAGKLPAVREWYGNVNGDRIVDGYDALAGRAASSDSSHLWHLHISLYRALAGDDHATLEAVLVGDDTWAVVDIEEDEDMAAQSILPLGVYQTDEEPGGNSIVFAWIENGTRWYADIIVADEVEFDRLEKRGFDRRIVHIPTLERLGRRAGSHLDSAPAKAA